MPRYLFKIWFLTLLTATAFLAGCREEPLAYVESSSQPPVPAGDLYVRVRLNLANSGIPGDPRTTTRGTKASDLTTLGTTHENTINSIALFVYDADADTLIDVAAISGVQLNQAQNGETFSLDVDVFESQRAYIYVAANLPAKLLNQFVIGQRFDYPSFASLLEGYRNTINEIIPGSNGKQAILESLPNGGIPMTGQFEYANGSGKIITVASSETSPENPLELKADLSRIVAKVHVVVDSLEFLINNGTEKVTYVPAKDLSIPQTMETGQAADAKWLGWIRLKNVHYMPNGTNMSTYIFPKIVDGSPEDLNMDLESYIYGGFDLDLEFNAPMWAKDFDFLNGVALHKENIAAESNFTPVESYNETKYNSTISNPSSPDRYTKGMYCLENYFSMPIESANIEKLEKYEEAIPMITQVSIAARLTPRWIVVKETYKAEMDKFVDEFKKNPGEILREHGLIRGDFTNNDVARWEDISTRYNVQFTDEEHKFRSSFRIIETGTEADATDILNWSLKVNNLWSKDAADFESGKYPDGTFYVYDRTYDSRRPAGDPEPNGFDWQQQYLYLTAGAVASATDVESHIKTYSVPHLSGWGYYYTYIGAPIDGTTPYSVSQVTRNTYYLIHVTNFGIPGGTITRPEFIKVNTESVGWDYIGKGDINLH